MKRALFVGRFQPFHLGHLRVVKDAKRDGFDEIVIVIGSAQRSDTRENPFTSEERVEMIDSALQGIGLKYRLIPVDDTKSDEVWVENVETLAPKFDAVYANGPVKTIFEGRGYEIIDPKPGDDETRISGERIRKMIADSDERWKSMVAEKICEKILELNGVERIKKLNSL